MITYIIDGTRVKTLRIKRLVGFVDMVHRAGVTRDFLERLEGNPERKISRHAARRLADGVGLTLGEFLRIVGRKDENA